ncbi:MAG: ABC transporter permease [Acidimicrobiales bacterium]
MTDPTATATAVGPAVAEGQIETALTVRRSQSTLVRSLGERYSLIVAFAIMLGVFALIEPAKFYTHSNLDIILGSQSVLMIAVLGQVISLASGEFDISLAYVLGFANQFSAVLGGEYHWSAALVVVVTLLLGAGFGLINAILSVVFGIPSIVVTLGSGTLLAGLGQLVSTNNVVAGVGGVLVSATTTQFLDLPLLFFYALAASIVVWVILQHTRSGRHLHFVGQGPDVARLAGLRVPLIRMAAMVAGSTIAALAGLLLTGQLGSATPDTGTTYLLPIFAATFLGSTAIRVGQFNVWGAFIAVYFLSTGYTGLQEAGAQSWVQSVFYGGALVAAVFLGRVLGGASLRKIILQGKVGP